MIENQTRIDETDCIKFVERTTQKNYLRFVNEIGCWSYIGKLLQPRAQTISLEIPLCLKDFIVAHELMHTLGFRHEQCRPDRDESIMVNYQNIVPSKSKF